MQAGQLGGWAGLLGSPNARARRTSAHLADSHLLCERLGVDAQPAAVLVGLAELVRARDLVLEVRERDEPLLLGWEPREAGGEARRAGDRAVTDAAARERMLLLHRRQRRRRREGTAVGERRRQRGAILGGGERLIIERQPRLG